LTQESDDLINTITTDTSPLIREHVGALRSCISAATEFTQLKNIETASKVLDFCWSFTELGKALAIGATQGLANAATNAFDHPIELAVDVGMTMTVAILAPHYLCVYHALGIIHYLAPTIKDLTNIGMTYRSNPTQGIEDFKTYIAPITNFVEKINNKEFGLTRLVESGAMVAAQFYAEQKLYGGVSSLYGSIANKALTWAKNNPALQLNDYLKTADGLILKAVQGVQEPLPKERVTQTLHRTEDFFIATEFGKANKNNFQRSIYGYEPHRAFQAMTNINDQIKKGFYVVLDGLHKNHLEVYNKSRKWIKVINFDGTFNEHLTLKVTGSRNDLAKIR
jgi:hypothetical protein